MGGFDKQILKLAGLRVTSCRLQIMDVMCGVSRPISRDQISEKLGTQGPDKVTVYRTLERFVQAGIVHKAFIHKRKWLYELADHCTEFQCHPHFTCTACGRTDCLTGMKMPMPKSPYNGYKIEHQRVQLEGLCPHCAAKK
jgi:Fur family ferric uptake transcriptional regulator